ncbi:MAG: hypothetical protein LBS60_15315 [Deltaproteobacteria bacterium]|jgi:hypothetical protein|nr:hypothetical protein [Deltaproteobacteria bacterium]
MTNYRDYLPELKSSTLFQDIADDDLIELLETIAPPIVHLKAGQPLEIPDKGNFLIVLRSTPAKELQPRRFKYDMPKFGEPGMMMAEIPSLSRFLEFLGQKPELPFKPKPLDFDLECLKCSGEALTRFYNPKVAPAQSVTLRNFLGILAQKVMDVRRELFLVKEGRDIFNP